MVELTWQQLMWVTGIFLTLFIAWNGFLIAIIKGLLSRVITSMDAKIEALSKGICSPDRCEELKRVRRELTETRVELPMAYWRRDDALREQTIMQAKIDAVAIAQNQFVLREDQIRDTTVMHAKLDRLAERIERLLEGKAQ